MDRRSHPDVLGDRTEHQDEDPSRRPACGLHESGGDALGRAQGYWDFGQASTRRNGGARHQRAWTRLTCIERVLAQGFKVVAHHVAPRSHHASRPSSARGHFVEDPAKLPCNAEVFTEEGRPQQADEQDRRHGTGRHNEVPYPGVQDVVVQRGAENAERRDRRFGETEQDQARSSERRSATCPPARPPRPRPPRKPKR